MVAREPTGPQADITGAIDLQLLGARRQLTVLTRNPLADRRRLSVVSDAEALVALADPLLEEREQKLVTFGRT